VLDRRRGKVIDAIDNERVGSWDEVVFGPCRANELTTPGQNRFFGENVFKKN